MQERVFPQLLSTGRLNAHPSMIETSRLCVDAACPSEAGEGALYDVTSGILQCTGWRYRALATDHDQLNGKSGGYTADDFERVRLQAYHSASAPIDSMRHRQTATVLSTAASRSRGMRPRKGARQEEDLTIRPRPS
ncbi:hypothetical protein N2600_34405 (plasmid) [Rhizobium sp. WSM1274]|nr:hypothetical protein N2600_34405 [Rhizobium leguminosarum bv. viciae]